MERLKLCDNFISGIDNTTSIVDNKQLKLTHIGFVLIFLERVGFALHFHEFDCRIYVQALNDHGRGKFVS